MTLGIDIDDTITNTTIKANEYLKLYDPSFNDYHDLPKKRYKEYMCKYVATIMKNVELKKGVREAFEYLEKAGYKVILITARNITYTKDMKEITINYLKENHILYDKIIFGKNKKRRAAKKNKVDLFIDDKESVLDEIKKANIKTIRLTNEMSKHLAFTNWEDIVAYLKEEGKNER